jgi:hypothetical protein
MAYGDSVPQNGHTSFCLAGSHSACAPHAGHSCFSSADISPLAALELPVPGSGGGISGSTIVLATAYSPM